MASHPSQVGVRRAAGEAHARRDPHVESVIPRRFLWAADALVVLLAFIIAHDLAPGLQRLLIQGGPMHFTWLVWLAGLPTTPTPGVFRPVWEAAAALCLLGPITVLAMDSLGGYRPVEAQSRTRLVVSTVMAPVLGLSAFGLLVFALHSDWWSRTLMFTNTIITVAGLLGYRSVIRAYKRKRLLTGRYARAVAFIGQQDDVDRMVAKLQGPQFEHAYRLIGFFGVTGAADAVTRLMFPHLGHVRELSSVLVQTPIDLVVVLEPDDGAPWLKDVIRACDYFKVSIQIVPSALLALETSLVDLRVPVSNDPLSIPSVVLRPASTDSDALFLKRLFDIVVSAVLLTLLSPVFLIVAMAIKLSTPRLDVFYRWRVVGYRGRPFVGYKFTTMVEGSENRRSELMALNEMQGPVFKIKADPRVTRVGRFLRKHSLNELPQLWSVLKGDMSLVGPRPAFPHELAAYDVWHKRKLSVRPGMTCLWQVRGRNRISSFDDWVKMDLEYIDTWSLWLDVRILIRTVWAVVGGTGS